MRSHSLLVALFVALPLAASEPFSAGTLFVSAQTADGKPISGVDVTLCSNGPLGYSGFTDYSAGGARFVVPALTYVVSLSQLGYLPVTIAHIALVPNETVEFRVTLLPDPRLRAFVTASKAARNGTVTPRRPAPRT